MTTQPGVLVAGRYRLAEPVGQGGMGRVWRAHDLVLDRDVAIKELLLPATLSGEERAALFMRTTREARAAARLNHPGVVTIHDVVEHEGTPWIVMEYIAGQSLSALITGSGRLPWQRAAEIGAKIADALAHAHAAGIVHRDLKPDNVLLAGDRVVVTDFGIARMVDAASRLTMTGTIVGTPHYMAPEQLDGGEAGPAADMWSLGATLYTAVEGKPPFDGPTLTAVITAILARDPPPPEHAGQLTPMLARLLAKDPGARPAASETARTLAEARNGPGLAWAAADAGQVGPGAGRVPAASGSPTVTVIQPPGTGRRGGPVQSVTSPTPASRQHRRLLAVALPLVLVAIALGTYFGLSSHGRAGAAGGTQSPGVTRIPGLAGTASSGTSTHSTSASARASSPPKPPAVGDACLVGTWRDNGYDTTTTWDGTTVAMQGAAGNLDHISASGADVNTYGSGTAPLYGTYKGSTLEEVYKGTVVSTIRANPATHTASVVDHGWSSGSSNTYVYQGRSTTGYFNKATGTADKFSYTCSATTLDWIVDGKADAETRVSTNP